MSQEERRGRSLWGLAWWQLALSALPLPVVFLGGLLGVLLGIGGCALNVVVARGRYSTAAKVATMVIVAVWAWGLEIGLRAAVKSVLGAL